MAETKSINDGTGRSKPPFLEMEREWRRAAFHVSGVMRYEEVLRERERERGARPSFDSLFHTLYPFLYTVGFGLGRQGGALERAINSGTGNHHHHHVRH